MSSTPKVRRRLLLGDGSQTGPVSKKTSPKRSLRFSETPSKTLTPETGTSPQRALRGSETPSRMTAPRTRPSVRVVTPSDKSEILEELWETKAALADCRNTLKQLRENKAKHEAAWASTSQPSRVKGRVLEETPAPVLRLDFKSQTQEKSQRTRSSKTPAGTVKEAVEAYAPAIRRTLAEQFAEENPRNAVEVAQLLRLALRPEPEAREQVKRVPPVIKTFLGGVNALVQANFRKASNLAQQKFWLLPKRIQKTMKLAWNFALAYREGSAMEFEISHHGHAKTFGTFLPMPPAAILAAVTFYATRQFYWSVFRSIAIKTLGIAPINYDASWLPELEFLQVLSWLFYTMLSLIPGLAESETVGNGVYI